MREPSVLVQEVAAEHLEERQADWAYSRPVVALDLLWNFAFTTVAAVVLVLSHDEDSPMPCCCITPRISRPWIQATKGSVRQYVGAAVRVASGEATRHICDL